jgi:hypothetical protein
MRKTNEKLSEVLDIEPIQILDTEIVEVETKNTIEDDAEYARQNLRKLIDKGNDAANHIVEIAKQSEHPRAFEVAANMLKNLADMNKDLLEIQKRKKDLTDIIETKNNINVDKAVFVGSTTELVKFLKSNKE